MTDVRSILDDLNSVKWGRLRHGYGPASDVPDLLEALTSSDELTRNEAFHDLYILHQGPVYEASSHIVPFVIRLAESPQMVDRPGLLFLLASIADGSGEERHIRDVRAAIDGGVSLYLRLLHDVDAEVRLHAAHLLVRCHGDDIAQSLRDQLMVETDPVARATILFSIGDLGNTADASVVTRFLSYDDIETRFASAVAIAQLTPEQMPTQAIETLAQVVLDDDQTEGLCATPKNADDALVLLAAETLTEFGPRKAGFVAQQLLEGLPHVDSYCAMEPTYALLGVTFTERQDPIAPDDVTMPQRHVLTAMLEMPNLWVSDYTYNWPCGLFGLPEGRDGIEALLRCGRPAS